MNRLRELREDRDYYNTSIDYILYRTDVRKPYPKSIVDKEEIGV